MPVLMDGSEQHTAGNDHYQMLARIELLAAENDEFGDCWRRAFLESADQLTAQIAGARMAGTKVGAVHGRVSVPVPTGSDPEQVRRAFVIAVRDEVNRRIEAMASPGSFG